MIRRRFGVLSILASLFVTAGCVRGPDVQTGLSLRRVVIYRNGVGYYERQGRVDADEVTFKVRSEKVGDFLATLAVIEQGGSSVKSASFPVDVLDKPKDDDEEYDARFNVLLKPPPRKEHKDEDKLRTVKLSLDGKEHDLVVGYVAETPVWRPSYRLVIETDPAKKATNADLQAWGIVQNLSGEDWKGVKLSLVAGAPLAFQATLEKAVIPARPIVTDQGEVIAAVPTSETSLSDTPAPTPAAQAAPMADPSAAFGGAPGGPTLDGLLAQKEEEVALAEAAADERTKSDKAGGKNKYKQPAAKAPARPSGGGSVSGKDAKKTARFEAGNAPAKPRPAEAPPPPPPPMNPSPPRNVRALAAVAMESGATRYDLPFAVDVPNKSATMVLLLAKKVPGESIFLFAPDGGVPESASHPFRVARFTNDTKGLLERGPIAVFANGAFLGQGMVDPLPPGATATVPFALERGLALDTQRKENEEGSRLAKIESGEIEIERDWVTHTIYNVKNGSDQDAKVLVKHPRLYNTRLNNPPKGTEDNTGTASALVPVEVKARASGSLDVDERRVQRHRVDWLDQLAEDAVKAYINDPRADQAVVAQLKPALEARAKLRTSLDEKNALDIEANQLRIQSDELARNIKAIEKNNSAGQLRADLTARLAKASARLDEITKRTIVVEMTLNEQLIRFRDLVTNIKMLKPLPVP